MLIGAIESLNIFHNFYTSISIYIKSYLTNPIYFTGINKLENLSILKNYIFLIIFFLSTFIEMVIYVVSYSITVFSRVKSVDISPLGIMSCLLCYIPLKKCIDIFINPFPENMQFIAETAYTTFFNWIICIIIIFSSILSICSTTSLFLKISNFTNRGIVTKFPYNIIRHPLYASRIICIWASVLFIVILKTITIEENLAYIFIIIGALAYGITYTILYYYRAITEERHLYLDDDYKKYCKKVKYRFIPKFW